MDALVKRIVAALVASNDIRLFGAGRIMPGNPVSEALADRRPMFAAGMDVEAVVRFILKELAH